MDIRTEPKGSILHFFLVILTLKSAEIIRIYITASIGCILGYLEDQNNSSNQ